MVSISKSSEAERRHVCSACSASSRLGLVGCVGGERLASGYLGQDLLGPLAGRLGL
jgi:hypothetical protein